YRERHGNLGGALVAMCKLSDEPVHFVLEAHKAECVLHAVANVFVFAAADPGAAIIASGGLCTDPDVFENGKLRKDFGDLKGGGHAEGHAFRGGHAGDVAAVEDDVSGSGGEKSANRVEKGGLARSVRANHRPQFALRNIERHVAHRNKTAKALGYISNF